MAALGRPGYINLDHARDLNQNYSIASMETHAHTVLAEAYRAGVRYFDVARSYGKGEQFLGDWLRTSGLEPSEITVGSKWGYTYTAGWQVEAEVHEVKEHSLSVLRHQWQESKANLGLYLDLYQIHSATFESGVLENTAVLRELSRLKEEGVLIGLSVSGPGQKAVVEYAMQIELDGVRLFDCVQATWNLLEVSAGSALSEAHSGGMGVIVKEAVANGRLTSRNTDPDFRLALEILRTQAERLDTSLDALAIAAVLAQPWADVVLSGAAKAEHLQSNLKALQVDWDSKATNAISNLVESPDIYWQKRSNLSWN